MSYIWQGESEHTISNSKTEGKVEKEGYKWPSKKITVIIETNDKDIAVAYRDAMKAWNKTGAINFQETQDQNIANIIAKDGNLTSGDSFNGIVKTEELGVTNSEYDPQTKLFDNAICYIDGNKLKQYSAKYRMWVAEHELGHAVGLGHATKQADSVMVPSNPKTGITTLDTKTLNSIYSK